MNRVLAMICLALALPCAVEADEPRPAPPAAVMGIVPSPVPEEVREHVKLGATEGIFVKGVAPGSPAETAGLKEADIVLAIDGKRVLSREGYRDIVAGKRAGDVLKLTCLRAGQRIDFSVTLKPRAQVLSGKPAVMVAGHLVDEPRPASALRSRSVALDPERARRLAYLRSVGTLGIRPALLSPETQAAIHETRGAIIDELAKNTDSIDGKRLTRLMQRLRDLARDATRSRRNWMAGKAGEATLQFRDEEGTIVLTGADNLIQIELLDPEGRSVYNGSFNTEEERRAVPCDLPARFRALERR